MYQASIQITDEKAITLHADTHNERLIQIDEKIDWHETKMRRMRLGYFAFGTIVFILLAAQVEQPVEIVIVLCVMPFIWLIAEAVEYSRTHRRCSFAQRYFHHRASLRKWRIEYDRHDNFESSYV